MPAEILKVSKEDPDPVTIRYAANLISRGIVVGIPTDTYYGLAADPFNLSAVEQVYQAKGRPEQKAIPILVSSLEQAAMLARELPDEFFKLAKKFWPGALTLVLDASHHIPLKVTGNTGRVALRWADSKVACALIEAAGRPVTGTSANLSGFPACTNAEQLFKQLGDRLQLILDGGETGATLASTIIGLYNDTCQIMREGSISESAIREALGE